MTKNKSKPLALLGAALFASVVGHAQESMNVSGGTATGSGGMATYSIGQAVYTTQTGSAGSVAQGVQQAYEIFTLDVKDAVANIFLRAFPNPTVENLTLEVGDYHSYRLSYHLHDLLGNLIRNGEITAEQTQIDTAILPSSTYLLQVVNDKNQTVQSFKIIKK